MQVSEYINQSMFALIAGPCVVESYEVIDDIASHIVKITQALQIPYIFKASYKKANRSSINSFTGIGDQDALEMIAAIGHRYGVPTTTDVHSIAEVALAAQHVDIIQIPAFLCRQTDLLLAAAETGKVVNVKKGQFLSPESMAYVVEKIQSTGNAKVWLTERGTTFGYQDLVVDFRGLKAMQAYAPTIMDCTHALQQPNQSTGITGGRPTMIATMAKAAVAIGVNGLFIETHPRPQEALSDGANMLPLDQLHTLLEKLLRIRKAIQD